MGRMIARIAGFDNLSVLSLPDIFDARWNAVRTVDLLTLDGFGALSDRAWVWERRCQLVN